MTGGPATVEEDLPALVDLADALAPPGRRAVLGLVGPPGSGKSTLAAALVAAMADRAALVPMDGFHLADDQLRRLGSAGRKGAPDTFDAAGYVHLLRRLRDPTEDVVYAPRFDREQEQAVAGALAVPAHVRLVVTEGNYLLLDGPFRQVRDLLTQTWYLDVDPATRDRRLAERHTGNGRLPHDAEDWVARVDRPNAVLVERTRALADLTVRATRTG